jgi:hypothetical protein
MLGAALAATNHFHRLTSQLLGFLYFQSLIQDRLLYLLLLCSPANSVYPLSVPTPCAHERTYIVFADTITSSASINISPLSLICLFNKASYYTLRVR